jgi:cytidine and deoxycytidylate deaminase family protein
MKTKIMAICLLFTVSISAGSKPINQLSIEEERNHILSLAAMAYVYQDWQRKDISPSRGYNIGALLYDSKGDSIIAFERNSVNQYNDKTQHAEVRLMQGYMKKYSKPYLDGLQIITTLEPCMMCSGMMTFLMVDTTKYVQEDPEFGKNIERLAMPWTDPEGHVHQPNERCTRIKSILADYPGPSSDLNMAYERYIKEKPQGSMSDFLYSEEAWNIYDFWVEVLELWSCVHIENAKLLENIKSLLNKRTVHDNSPYGEKAHKKNMKLLKTMSKKKNIVLSGYKF